MNLEGWIYRVRGGGGVYKERRGWRGKRCFEEERKEKRLMWKEGGLGCKNCFTVSGEN